MGQPGVEDVEGVKDGCSEGIEEATSNERIDLCCLKKSIEAGSENDSNGGCVVGIEDGFEDDALATKELPKRATKMPAAHENLMVADLEESFMRRA
jgi:hypothetical protein